MKIFFIVLAVCIALPTLFVMFIFLGSKASNSAYKKINADLSSSYFSKEGKIYYSTGGNLTFVGAYELFGSGAESFRVLGEIIAMDKDRIYFGKLILAAARKDYEDVAKNELESIEAHPDLLAAKTDELTLYFYQDSNTGKQQESTFLTDQQQVFAFPQLAEKAIPAEFNALSYNYGHDNQNIFYKDSIIAPYRGQSIRVDHFKWQSDMLYLGDSVYIDGQLRADIHAASYKTIGDKHSIDRYTAYFERQPIKDSDPRSYQTFNKSEYYSKDEKHVYFSGVKLHNADPQSFKLYGDHGEVAADKNHFYMRDIQILNQKPGTDFRLSPASMDSYKYQTLQVTENTAFVVSKDDFNEVHNDSAIVIYDNKVFDRFRGLLEGANASDVKVMEINTRYTQSAGKLYFEATEMKHANPDACTIYPSESGLSNYAETTDFIYYLGKKIKIDGVAYQVQPEDGTLQSYEGNNLVCNKRVCFYNEKLVRELNPQKAAEITYDEMENYSLAEN